LSHSRNIRSSTEAAQYHINTAAYSSTVNSSGQKPSFFTYYYNSTPGRHKLIDASTDRNIRVFTSALSTDLCTQLLNIVLSVHRQHSSLPTRLIMLCQRLTESGWDSFETGQTLFHAPPSLQFVSFPTQISALPPSTLCLSLQQLLYTMQYETTSFKKHTATFPAEAETAPRSIHYTMPRKQQRRPGSTLPQLSLLPFLLDAKYI